MLFIITGAKKPSVAAIDGLALGGGLEVAMVVTHTAAPSETKNIEHLHPTKKNKSSEIGYWASDLTDR